MTAATLTALAALERRYDGAIPEALRRAALAGIAPTQAEPLVAPPPIEKPRRARRAVLRAMAEVLRVRAAADGACTEADLKAAGFTAEELADHLEAARALARRHLQTEA